MDDTLSQNPSTPTIPAAPTPSLGTTGDIASFVPSPQQGVPAASVVPQPISAQQPVVPVSPFVPPAQQTPVPQMQQPPIFQQQAEQPLMPVQPMQPVQPVVAAEASKTQSDQLPFSEKKLSLDDLYGSSNQMPQQPVLSPVETQPTSEVPFPPEPIAVQSQPEIQQQAPIQGKQMQTEEVTTTARRVPEVAEVGTGDSEGGDISGPEDKETAKSGFHVSQILKFVLGGLVVLLIVMFGISFISSLFKPQASGRVTLTYWGLWEDSSVMQGIINGFERDHPDITVNYIKEDPKDYPQRLVTRIANGNGPDIFRFHNSWVTPLQSVLLPLPSSVVDPSQLQKIYYPVVGQDLVKNGAVYGLPLDMDSLSLFVNKDIFDHAGAKVPTTWDQFVTVAKALTVKDPSGKIKTSGAAMGTYDNITHAPDIVSLLMLQNGANLQKLDKSQNANDAMVFYTSFAKGDNTVWDSTLDTSLLAFQRGEVAMYFGYSWDVLSIQATSPQLKFAVYPVPHLPNRPMTVASYWVEGVSNKSTHQKEALEFMQYLSQKDTVSALYTAEAKSRKFGELYARSDLAESIKADPLLTSFVSQSQNAVSTFFTGETNYDDFNGRLNQYLGNAINSILTDTSVETAMQTLSEGVSQVVGQYAQKTP